MTQLKFTINLTTDCNIIVTDTTGFSTDNATGFALETAVSTPYDVYKLSEGYFLDILTLNGYNEAPTVVLTGSYLHKATEDVVTVYANNFTPITYKLAQDSTFTLTKFFIMSEEFYNQEKTTGRFDTKVIYYTDGTDLYKVESGVASKITLAAFMLADPTLVTTNLRTEVKFASVCYLTKCYQNLIQLTLGDGCTGCATDIHMKQRDFLYMSLEAIKYLTDTGYTTEIQKIIEALDLCGGICKSVTPDSNCGCSG